MKNVAVFAMVAFCGFIKTKVSLGSASVLSQEKCSRKTVLRMIYKLLNFSAVGRFF